MIDLSPFVNRIKKNLRHRRSWAKKLATEAFRVYERDIPEMPYIVDLYGSSGVIYDKAAGPHAERLPEPPEVISAVATALGLAKEAVHFKLRRRQQGITQYEKMSEGSPLQPIQEGKARFLVNLADYLDTGLFLDHRPLRYQFASSDLKGQRFLNLFCYTGSVSVAAALGGADCVSVDMSNTYLEWAEKNFVANGLDPKKHEFLRENALEFLSRPPLAPARFDIVFLDPPTFSNSKKMDGSFDVQRDHAALLAKAMRFVREQGVLYFSTNRHRFSLDEEVSRVYQVRDISLATIPDDFRDKKIHRCYELRQLVVPSL